MTPAGRAAVVINHEGPLHALLMQQRQQPVEILSDGAPSGWDAPAREAGDASATTVLRKRSDREKHQQQDHHDTGAHERHQ